METTTILIAKLDVLCAFATVSLIGQIPWIRPKMSEDGNLIV